MHFPHDDLLHFEQLVLALFLLHKLIWQDLVGVTFGDTSNKTLFLAGGVNGVVGLSSVGVASAGFITLYISSTRILMKSLLETLTLLIFLYKMYALIAAKFNILYQT
jgi:hypothetical protein